jgi:hypothetical protein
MTFEKLTDIEVRIQESDASTSELCDDIKAFIKDWDAPENKDNLMNWSSCKFNALLHEKRLS